MRESKVNYRETLTVYLRSDSMEQAAKNLNITSAGLYYRLQTMKKAGVKVPKKDKTAETLSSPLYIAQLNSLINKYQKEK